MWRHALSGLVALLTLTMRVSAALELTVEAPPEYSAEASRVKALQGTDLSATAALLGVPPDSGIVRVVLAAEGSPLASHAPSWVSGYAIATLSTIVLFPSRVPSYPDRNLEALFEHEMAHLLIGRAAGGRLVPRWFNEGLATVAAREWGIEDRARFALAVIGRGPRTTADLDDGFLGDTSSAARSYAMSAALVRHLIRRFGASFVARTLHAMAAGSSFDDAFRSATGSSPTAAAAVFFNRETFWNTWVPFLTSTTALWMGITLLTLLAIRSRRRRDAEIRSRWEDEERMLEPRHPLRSPPHADDETSTVN